MTESKRRREALLAAPDDVRSIATAMLDEMTRPLTVKEMEAELVQFLTRKQAREIINALKLFDVVLLKPKPGLAAKPGRLSASDGTTAPT